MSTDGISQTQSFETQKSFYINYVKNHPGWNLIGLYSDEGLSATTIKGRRGLQMMLQDAEAGKIDMIVTKSVSRFSRNSNDFRFMIKKLKSLSPPVEIYFETETLSTFDPAMDLAISMLAIFAEQESVKKSEAITSAQRMRYDEGFFLVPDSLGYDRSGVNEISVNEEEAETIRLIYDMYLAGFIPAEIADTLRELRRRKHTHVYFDGSRKEGNYDWTASSVLNVLENEKKCGDVLAQKTYTIDCLEHKVRKNYRNIKQYYGLDQHPAIISREDYYLALKIKRGNRGGWAEGVQVLKTYNAGALQGCVLTVPRWHGFCLSDYLRASLRGYGIDMKEESLYPDYVMSAMSSAGQNDVEEDGLVSDEDDEKTISHFYAVSKEEFDSAPAYTGEDQKEPEEEIPEEVESELEILLKSIRSKISVKNNNGHEGCLPVSGRLFSIQRKPVVTIDKCGIFFNKECYKRLVPDGRADRVEILFNPVRKDIYIRLAGSESSKAQTLRWIKDSGEISMVRCPAGALSKAIFESEEWDKESKYKILGDVCSICGAKYLIFDLTDPIVSVNTNRRADQEEVQNASKRFLEVEVMPDILKKEEYESFDYNDTETTGKVENRSRAVYFENDDKLCPDDLSIHDYEDRMYDPSFIRQLIQSGITPVEGWDYLNGIIKWTKSGFQLMSPDWKESYSEKRYKAEGIRDREESKETITGWTTKYSFPTRESVRKKIERLKEGVMVSDPNRPG
ncbi:MAG: recombinase family protein [Lachnospiraceae bacterium]|nr:recombinase family protein [Lachnospiraceae bacterium]